MSLPQQISGSAVTEKPQWTPQVKEGHPEKINNNTSISRLLKFQRIKIVKVQNKMYE